MEELKRGKKRRRKEAVRGKKGEEGIKKEERRNKKKETETKQGQRTSNLGMGFRKPR